MSIANLEKLGEGFGWEVPHPEICYANSDPPARGGLAIVDRHIKLRHFNCVPNQIRARIYQPTKSAMQSGRALVDKAWVLEYLPEGRIAPEALMGWQSSESTTQQVKVYFPTAEAAAAFATEKGIAYDLIEPHTRKIPPKNYIQNFTAKVRTR